MELARSCLLYTSELLNAVHNVSDEEFKKGVTYIDLMNHNVKVLKEALN